MRSRLIEFWCEIRHLKSLEYKLSPLGWGVINFFFFILIWLIFEPTIFELITLLIVENLSLAIVLKFEPYFLRNYLPAFFWLKEKEIEKNFLNQKKSEETLLGCFNFPKKFAWYCFISSWVKIIPGICIVLFVWSYSWSVWEQASKIFFLTLVLQTYFYGAVFNESHVFVSNKIREWHKKLDLTQVFLQLRPQLNPQDSKRAEGRIFFALSIFIISLLTLTAFHSNSSTPLESGLNTLGISFSGFGLLGWMWYVNRDFLLGSMESLFMEVDEMSPLKPVKVLPLHSDPLLAKFEATINSLSKRIKKHEHEMSVWVLKYASESRYKGVWEAASLIVHDLGAPLQLIQYCSEKLNESKNRHIDNVYSEKIEIASQRCVELIHELRGYIRDPEKKDLVAQFGDCYRAVIKILEGQFWSEHFSTIQFNLDPILQSEELKISRQDLIHVLINVLSNSAKNLIQNGILQGRVDVYKVRDSKDRLIFAIRDNGTGLSYDEFRSLRGDSIFSEDRLIGGLGLRLVCRLVERQGGAVRWTPTPNNSPGTLMHLELLRADKGEQNIEVFQRTMKMEPSLTF